MQKLLIGLLLAGLATLAGAETVYKWVDTSGQLHYTDLPPQQAGAKILAVYEQEAGLIAEEGYAEGADFDGRSDDSGQSASSPTPEPPVSEEAMAAVQEDVARAEVEQCAEAKERYQRYIDSRRLFREKDGKREYLTDQELTEARARAKQSVDEYCS